MKTFLNKSKEFIIRNNKLLLLVVGLLLVISISISFAYFTGRADYYAKKVELLETTAVIEGEKVIVNGNLSFNDFDILPGHKNISELKVSSNEITNPVFFNLTWNGINNLNTPLNFYVYKTESEIDTGATCEKIKKNIDGTIRYYEECSIKNETLLREAINTGTISKSDTEAKVNLLNDEYITPTENERYYYVVLEYPNLDESQNEDIGGNFSGKVTAEAGDPTKRLIYVNVENGSSNPDKKIVNVGATESFNITPNDKYSMDSATVVCTNNTNATLSDNTLTLSNITNHDTCTVTLIRNDYTININVTNGNGTTATTLSAGDSATYNITPNSGYVIDGADVTGNNCNLSGNTLSINNISNNVNCNINIKNSKWSRYNVNSSTTYYWNKYKIEETGNYTDNIIEESGSFYEYKCLKSPYGSYYENNNKLYYRIDQGCYTPDLADIDSYAKGKWLSRALPKYGGDEIEYATDKLYYITSVDEGVIDYDCSGDDCVSYYKYKVYYSKVKTPDKVYSKGEYIEKASSFLSSNYPTDGMSGDYWYIYDKSEVNYSKGSYVDSIVALYGTYPTNDKSETYWYVRN